MAVQNLKRQGRQRIIPAAWWDTPNWAGKMTGVNIHWTAGAYKVSGLDIAHYHVILGGKGGAAVRGKFTPRQNQYRQGANYAAHTRNHNTARFGLSIAAMAGARQGDRYAGQFPLLESDWERLAEAAAEILDYYKLPVAVDTCIQHGEVQRQLGIRQNGKWDIVALPWDWDMKPEAVCDLFRDRVRFYLSQYHGAGIEILAFGKPVEGVGAYLDPEGHARGLLRPLVTALGWEVKHAQNQEALLTKAGAEKRIPYIQKGDRGEVLIRATAELLGVPIFADPAGKIMLG